MRIVILAALIAGLAGPAAAQNVTRLDSPGNLAPTQDPGCVPLGELANDLSPADLGLGLEQCLAQGRYPEAADIFVLMGLRTKYDTYRVTDTTAHEAGVVIQQTVTAGMSPDQSARLNAAFAALGGNGSPWHTAFCAQMRDWGPPSHDPTYMIAHGMGGMLHRDQPPIVPGFDPDSAWAATLGGYMHCAPVPARD